MKTDLQILIETYGCKDLADLKRCFIDNDLSLSMIQDAMRAYREQDDEWVRVEDAPLYINTELGWECTEAGDGEFLAAVPYFDFKKPGEHWWIRHCVVQDEVGLCVVGDIDNEPAGWELKAVTHYKSLPSPPKQEATIQPKGKE